MSNFERSDGCDAIFRSKTTEHPLKMSGMVREGNPFGFLARVTKNKRLIFHKKKQKIKEK